MNFGLSVVVSIQQFGLKYAGQIDIKFVVDFHEPFKMIPIDFVDHWPFLQHLNQVVVKISIWPILGAWQGILKSYFH